MLNFSSAPVLGQIEPVLQGRDGLGCSSEGC